MNDLDLVRAVTRHLDARNGATPDALHERIMDELEVAATRPNRARHLPHRFLSMTGTLTAVAAAVAVVMIVSGGAFPFGTRSTVATDGHQQAVAMLLAAASTARRQDSEAPSPGSYVYAYERVTGTLDEHGTLRKNNQINETWWSADGKHPSAAAYGNRPLTVVPVTDPAYRPELPTTHDAMLRYLQDYFKLPAGEGAAPRISGGPVFAAAEYVLNDQWVRGSSRAAIYSVLATLPNVTMTSGVRTLNGRTGVSVAAVELNERRELIFDPETHQLIGIRLTALEGDRWYPAGTVVFETSIITRTVVSALGERPDGTRRQVHGLEQ